MAESDLVFTGERFLPDCEREIWYEHFHRYTMAVSFARGKKVLDAACGEGYGSHLLAQSAASVVGVDVSETAIKHASKHYSNDNLAFKQANVLSMKFADNSFDLVVSFETLEHLVEHDELMREFKRVLKADGVLLISTPDKKEYSDKTGFKNEFHFKELYQHEFADLLSQSFKFSQWYGQKLMFTSTIWNIEKTHEEGVNSIQFDCMNEDNMIKNIPTFDPVYFIVAVSDDLKKIQSHKDMYGFAEHAEQIYGHYNAVIRAHIEAEQQCKRLTNQQKTWQQHPIIGRCIKWFSKE